MTWGAGASLGPATGQCGAQRRPGRTCAMFALLVLLACAHASGSYENGSQTHHNKDFKTARKSDLPSECLYDGRWHADGAAVRMREACLRCECARGALSCRRQTCAPLPEPPPRCHVLHRKGQCCPELHCADGVRHQNHAASARVDDDIAAPASSAHACVEGGTVYAAGSAMSSNTACEQCFCLGGARRCVRPRCLSTPDGCQPRPSPGACCPQRYYCQHVSTKPPTERNPHDCKTQDGTWVPEGERVSLRGEETKCAHCFCLRGSIRCQNLSCAPALQGCLPLVQPGQCCPHQYQCDIRTNGTKVSNLHNKKESLILSLNENRTFHKSKATKRETTIKTVSSVTVKSTSTISTTKKPPATTVITESNATKTLATTTTSASAPTGTTVEKTQFTNATNTQPNQEQVTPKMMPATKSELSVTTDETTEKYTTEQPEKTVKIIINGTINCTTEVSSATLMLNTTNTTDSVWIQSSVQDSQPRVPFIDTEIEAHTYASNDIITNRSPIEGFDEDEIFTINVTSSLRTNTTLNPTSTTLSTTAQPKTSAPIDSANISKPKKEELDYDYTEPTLPPSLPNLKIIPFVAADAVVDYDIIPKDNHPYSMLEREDKFPVYYPSIDTDTKENSYATRKEDIYNPTQYPIFVSKNIGTSKFSAISAEEDISNVAYPSLTNDLVTSVHEYTVTASLGGVGGSHKMDAKLPNDNDSVDARTPAINLFSPPMKTEGGFLPKSPGVADEFYSMYPSTPPGPSVPHLTTSMQLEPKEECITSDGQRVAESSSINLGCSICICAWGDLHCSPKPCITPPGCKWRAASIHALDLCCGELICEYSNKTTTPSTTITTRVSSNDNSSQMNKWEDTFEVKNINSTHNPGVDSYTIKNLLDNVTDPTQYLSKLNEMEIDLTTIPPFKPFVNFKNTTPSKSSNSSSFIEDYGNSSHSNEYEDEDDDEGFSLGSVLKLLLSESYDTKKSTTTTAPAKKIHVTTLAPIKKATKLEQQQFKQTTSSPIDITKLKLSDTVPNKFIPMPPAFSYIIPPKKLQAQNTINRIDHLLLGESTAIKETTPRPPPTWPPTISTTKKPFTSKPSNRPYTTKPDRFIDKEISTEINSYSHKFESLLPISTTFPSSIGFGLPKLAGCNIYGQMYRVGRIIAELSTPCKECRCTDIGVQCKSLSC